MYDNLYHEMSREDQAKKDVGEIMKTIVTDIEKFTQNLPVPSQSETKLLEGLRKIGRELYIEFGPSFFEGNKKANNRLRAALWPENAP